MRSVVCAARLDRERDAPLPTSPSAIPSRASCVSPRLQPSPHLRLSPVRPADRPARFGVEQMKPVERERNVKPPADGKPASGEKRPVISPASAPSPSLTSPSVSEPSGSTSITSAGDPNASASSAAPTAMCSGRRPNVTRAADVPRAFRRRGAPEPAGRRRRAGAACGRLRRCGTAGNSSAARR